MRSSTSFFNSRKARTPSAVAAAVSSILAAGAASSAAAQEAGGQLQEIVVTAQKRSENLQSVPISIQAFDNEKLQELQVADFQDYARFLPSLSYLTYGPGQAQLYMRGVTNGPAGLHVGTLPLVGVYLDEQPVTTIANALDVHIYDIERVELLSGPQGTLYGASSMAGTLRIITNKPSTKEFKAGYNVELNGNTQGGRGETLEGFVNMPLSDKVAVRLVGFTEHDPGFIDNVAGPPQVYPTSGVVRDNTSLHASNFNDTRTSGGRAALRVDLDDSWTIAPAVTYQQQKAHGAFFFDPTLGDLKINRYFPEHNDDHWYQAALTVHGKLSSLDLVYSGGYMQRKVDNVSDYSDYSYFYDVAYHSQGVPPPDWLTFNDNAGNPINPASYIVSRDTYTKQTHELRLSSAQDERLRFVAGMFLQRQTDDARGEYRVDGLADSLSITGFPGIHYLNSQWRVDRDRALFGEVSYDLTDRLSVTGGARVFDYRNTVSGFFGFGAGLSTPGGNPGEGYCFASASPGSGRPCINIDNLATGTHSTPKLNFTYKLAPDAMLYATWSNGFRAGGVNRLQTYQSYRPDYLSNYEMGWKTTWLNHRLRFNGALFVEEWKDAQFGVNGPYAITVIVNAGHSRIKGIESELDWAATEHLTLSASGTVLEAKTTTNTCAAYDPTFSCTDTPSNHVLAPAGTRLPLSPKFKGNALARYQFELGTLQAHTQLAGVYQSDVIPLLRVSDAQIVGPQPSYFSLDAAVGLAKDSWTLDAYVSNLTDERGQAVRFTQCAPSTCSAIDVLPIKPRIFGVRFGQKF